MTKPLTPRDHPQPGDLNPQTEGEMVGNKKQRHLSELGIDPDAVLAAMVAHTLGEDRLEINQANGIVIRSNIPVLAITPELGPYYKVYKEIEKNELEKDPENGTMNTVAKAQKKLFMMKVRVPFWDSMIPDPPLYDLNNELTIKLQNLDSGELTPQESFSIKCIAMHTTFVGKRGGFFSSNIPPVGAYVRVAYDNVKTLAGPQYLGEVELQIPPPEGFPDNLLSAFGIFGGGSGCNGGLGNHPAVQGAKTIGKKIVKSIFGKDEKKQMQDEIWEIQTKLAELDGKEDAASREARSSLIAKKSELKAKLNPGDGATPSAGTDAGERRQDPTVPPSSPTGTCQAGFIGGSGQPGPPGSNVYLPPQSIKPPNSDPGAAVKEAARLLGIPEAVVMAFRSVESAGKPAAIRFEPHHFLGRYRPDLAGVVPWTESPPKLLKSGRMRKGTSVSYDVPSETNAAAFRFAYSHDPIAAVCSTSWGLFQVMGWQFFSVDTMKGLGNRAVGHFNDTGGKVPRHTGWNGQVRYKPKKTLAGFVNGGAGSPEFGFTSGQQARSAFDSDPTGTSWKLLKVWVNEAGTVFVQAANTPDFHKMAMMYNGDEAYGPRLAKAYARHTAPV